MMRSQTLRTPESPSDVREMLDHAAYYFPLDRAQAFDRLRSNQPPVSLSHDVTNRSLNDCVVALKHAGVRIALVDMTSPDVATGPFRVMRAVSPDLQPIWYGYSLERKVVNRIGNLGLDSNLPPINPIW